jgi:hypothetical protein
MSDEALESAAGTERAAHYTLNYCAALDRCSGPQPLPLEIRHRLLALCSLFKRKGPRLERNGPFPEQSALGSWGL